MKSAVYDVLDGLVAWLLSRSAPARDPGASLLIGGDQVLVSERAEITYAPPGTLGVGAPRIAPYGDDMGEGRTALYVFKAGATLAYGQPARAPHGHFGLYDPNYRMPTRNGVALFDAMVAWLVGGDESPGSAVEDV